MKSFMNLYLEKEIMKDYVLLVIFIYQCLLRLKFD